MLLGLGLAPLASAQLPIGGDITNVVPVVTSVTVTGSSFDPTSGTTTSIPVTTVITDTNGCNDLTTGSSSVTVAVYTSGDVVLVSPAALTYASCSLGVAATFSGNALMPFHAAAGTYKVRVAATDQAAGAVSASLVTAPTFTYGSLVAMTTAASFSFSAAVAPGASTAVSQGIDITNKGNGVMDAQVSGTALTLSSPSASIAVSNVAYSVNSDMSSSTALSGSATSLAAFDLAAGASSSKTLYLQLTAPSAASQYLPAGTYSGTLTVTAVSG
ncbi:MAG: hypothetical protein AABY18_09465 [Candidatus Thermoplasmatota archaeon]